MSLRIPLLVLMIGCLIAMTAALFIGEHTIAPSALWRDNLSLEHSILLQLRLPHILSAFAIGGLLALSGCLMQAMVANPLADPYILGSSGGAAVFTLTGLLLGFEGVPLISCSLLGVMLAMGLLHWLVGGIQQASPRKLLLFGVMLAAGWGTILSVMLLIAPTTQTKSLLFWLFGDIDTYQSPVLALCSLLVCGFIAYRLTDEINLLSQGHLLAQTLGVDTQKLQTIIFVLSAGITAITVSIAGTIGFVGLVVPHCARLIIRTQSKLLIPCCILLGSILLVSADLLSRVLLPVEHLPVGLVTTLLGIPLFLYLARQYD